MIFHRVPRLMLKFFSATFLSKWKIACRQTRCECLVHLPSDQKSSKEWEEDEASNVGLIDKIHWPLGLLFFGTTTTTTEQSPLVWRWGSQTKNQQGADSVDDLTGSKCQRNIFCVRRKHVWSLHLHLLFWRSCYILGISKGTCPCNGAMLRVNRKL